MAIAPILFLILFAAILLYLGWVHGDASSAENFNMGGRKAGWIEVAFGAFTVVGAGEYIGLTAYTHDLGVFSLSLILGIALGALVLAVLGRRAYVMSKRKKYSSLPDFIADEYGILASFLCSAISVIALGSLLLIQFSLGGAILAEFLGIHLALAIASIALVVIGYVWLGGLKAILFTDVVQGSAMLLFLATIVLSILFGPTRGDFSTHFVERAFQPIIKDGDMSGLYFAIVLFFSGLTAVSGGADIWQRLFCGESFKKSQRGLLMSAVLFIVFGLLLVVLATQILGVIGPETSGEAGNAFISYFTKHISPFWLGVAVVGLFAGIVSTADAELLLISVVTSKELNRQKLNRDVEIVDTRWLAVLLGVIAATGGYFAEGKLDEVFRLLLFLLMITGATAWVSLCGCGSRKSVSAGLLLSIGIFFGLWVFGIIFDGLWSLLIPCPILASFLIRGAIGAGHMPCRV